MTDTHNMPPFSFNFNGLDRLDRHETGNTRSFTSRAGSSLSSLLYPLSNKMAFKPMIGVIGINEIYRNRSQSLSKMTYPQNSRLRFSNNLDTCKHIMNDWPGVPMMKMGAVG